MSKLWIGVLLFLGVWPHELSADSKEASPGPQKTEFKSPLLAWWFSEPTPPTKPFELTRDEEQRIDAVLEKWEIATSEIQSFSCRFTRWDYDESFGPKHNEYLISERHGVLKFRRPDSGLLRDDRALIHNGHAYENSRDPLEHWISDGRSLANVRAKIRTVQFFPLPNRFCSHATCDGPLPFLFPVQRKTLHDRFWFRDSTPNDKVEDAIWLEAYPKNARDACMFHKIEVILKLPSHLPIAMESTAANRKDRNVYLLEDLRTNNQAEVTDADFQPPTDPEWKYFDRPPQS
jgi:TIGR03009 family protein